MISLTRRHVPLDACLPAGLGARILVALVALGVGVSEARAEDWYRVESADGTASVLFPNQAEDIEEIVDKTPAGSVVTQVAKHEGEGILMSISKTTLPGLASFFAGKKMIFKNAKGGVLSSSYGREVSSKKIDIAGADAAMLMRYQSVHFDDPEHPGFNGLALFVIQNEHIYTINSMITKETPDNEAMQEKLLRSFQISG